MSGKTTKKNVSVPKYTTKAVVLSVRDFNKLRNANYAVGNLMATVRSLKPGDNVAVFETSDHGLTGGVFLLVVDNPVSTPPVLFGMLLTRSVKEVSDYYKMLVGSEKPTN